MIGQNKPAVPMVEGEIVHSKTDAPLNEVPSSETASVGRPKEEIIPPEGSPDEERISIVKPEDFSLEGFRSTKPASLSIVATLQAGLPHHNMAAAKDFVRLHPDEAAYWSEELCFVNVTVQGQARAALHLINETLAMKHLEPAQIQRFRLALATKPHDRFFLCHVPSQRLDNSWNESSLAGCVQAKTLWTEVVSLKDAGHEHYKINSARDSDAFPEPKWPPQSLNQLIFVSFANFMIQRDDHPALLRKVGAKQSLS
jgi:hypothetical protein